jgi:hypothetical protein
MQLTLFSTATNAAIFKWDVDCKSVVWSIHRPTVFFVLDWAGRVSVWDLQQDTNSNIRDSREWSANVLEMAQHGDHLVCIGQAETWIMQLQSEWTEMTIGELEELEQIALH